ncbi:MAG: T9SS type A sorting domain-containing protein [Sphingobacteriales bacterium]|nr:MAG: T9SS type A sorting domain-containing protein [Sphingobacteriales bacterium]
MKKLLLSILFPLFFGAASYAQQSYDLDFEFKLDKGEDTLRIGETGHLNGKIKNNGPDDFNGDISFNVSIFHPNLPPDFPLENGDINFTLSPTPFTFNIKANGNATFTVPIPIDNNWKKYADSNNIVIIWPSDGYKDNNSNNDYGQFRVYIIDPTNIFTKTKDNSLFSVYPNPANNMVKISFESVRKGEITLSDITGKILRKENIAPGSQSISLPLDICGNQLPAGLYFIGLQTDNQHFVKKLQIIR